jgi:2-dehydropantoate 2-reductase
MKGDYDFVILGAGALGSILGAHLTRAGHSVAMLARGKRAEQIRAEGLRLTGLTQLSIPVETLSDASQLQSARVLIVAMKTPGTAEALVSLHHVAVELALSIQNGPMKNELLADAFGEQRVLGALADTSGELLPGGEVVFTRNVNIMLGELTEEVVSPRARRIAADIDASGVRAVAVAEIRSLEWTKFAAWVGLMALSVTTRSATWRYLSDPGSARVLVRLVREIGQLMRVLNIPVAGESVLPVAAICNGTEQDAVSVLMRVGHEFELQAPRHRMSSLQDLEGGRALEIHETLGYALSKAAQNGLALPLLDSVHHLISAIDRMGRRTTTA